MSAIATIAVGSQGEVTIPASIRAQAGIDEKGTVEVEAGNGVIVIRAAADVEEYSLERKAEFLLSTAVDEDDYQAARAEVVKFGIDPDTVPHVRPTG
jgi:AbrB family looped-hinge helix DNA binding protein